MVTKNEFIVQRYDGEWCDMALGSFDERDRAIDRMLFYRKKYLTDPNLKFRVVHRITTELIYSNKTGVGYRWQDKDI